MKGNNNKYEALFSIPDFSDDLLSDARKAFRSAKSDGIITNGSFDDDVWLLTDEYATYSINYKVDGEKAKESLAALSITAGKFSLYMKFFIVFRFGLLALGTFRYIVYQLKEIIYLSPDKSIKKASSLSESGAKYSELIDFFSEIPVKDENAQAYIDGITDELDKMNDEVIFSTTGTDRKRRLAAFESYFLFDDILNDFWQKCDSSHEKAFYYPVYLWWKITAVIPTRPKEFVVTPRNWLEQTDDGWLLTLRKSIIKGANKRKGYRISRDFMEHKYLITDELADSILDYMFITRDYPKTDINTLFIPDPHYEEWGYGRKINSRYYTYINLSTALKYFYSKVIIERYGYTLVPKSQNVLGKNEIQFINLGDTRHISMINMIMEGASPVTAMLLAGHSSVDTSAHYFGNVSTLVECKVMREVKRLTTGAESYSLSQYHKNPLQVSDFTVLSGNARCYSPRFAKEDYSDCEKVAGPHGEIGWCEKCTYYRNSGLPFSHSADKYKQQIEAEASYLAAVIERVREHRGEKEEIGEALLRLNSAAYSYRQYLKETGAKEIDFQNDDEE